MNMLDGLLVTQKDWHKNIEMKNKFSTCPQLVPGTLYLTTGSVYFSRNHSTPGLEVVARWLEMCILYLVKFMQFDVATEVCKVLTTSWRACSDWSYRASTVGGDVPVFVLSKETMGEYIQKQFPVIACDIEVIIQRIAKGLMTLNHGLIKGFDYHAYKRFWKSVYESLEYVPVYQVLVDGGLPFPPLEANIVPIIPGKWDGYQYDLSRLALELRELKR